LGIIVVPIVLLSVTFLFFPPPFLSLEVERGDVARALSESSFSYRDPANVMSAGDDLGDWARRMLFYFLAPGSLQYRLAAAYTKGVGYPQDPVFGAALLYSAAERGNPYAQIDMATIYDKIGMAGSEREVAASRYLLEAAESGDVEAQFRIADRYRFGRGVIRDSAESERWYRAAAAQGDPRAITLLNRILPPTQ
jgi:TPR repeat protein